MSGLLLRPFDSFHEANAVATRLQAQRGSNRRPYNAYLCADCGRYHVGRKPPKGKRARLNRDCP